MKKIVIFLAIIICSTVNFFNVANIAYAKENYAEVLLECQTRRILHEKNKNLKLPMASTTKVLTAILIVEECCLDDTVKIPKEAVGVEGSSVYLKENEELKVKDLLYCLMLRSGNDSAVALALHHSGSISAFAKCMNEFAKKIGVENSNFCNPHGLHNENHYTTAYDLALITCYALNNPVFQEIVSTRSITIYNSQGEQRYLVNKNKMLQQCEGANGVKTGYTTKAGRCLISSVERVQTGQEEGKFKSYGKMKVVCVVLNVYNMFERSQELINHAFCDYTNYIISSPQAKYNKGGKEYYTQNIAVFPLKKGETNEINFEVCVDDADNVKKGDKAGKLKINLQNQLIFLHNLYYN